MPTILVYFAGGLAVLIIASLIPGLNILVKPLVESLWKGMLALMEMSASWVVWLIKSLFRAHGVILKHLVSSEDELDPGRRFRE